MGIRWWSEGGGWGYAGGVREEDWWSEGGGRGRRMGVRWCRAINSWRDSQALVQVLVCRSERVDLSPLHCTVLPAYTLEGIFISCSQNYSGFKPSIPQL